MTKRDVAELAVRILALTILALGIYQILFVPVQLVAGLWDLMRGGRGNGLGHVLLLGSISSVLTLALVCLLWVRAEWIAHKLVPDEGNDARWPHVRVADLQTAAFSTVGIVAVLWGVGTLARSLGMYLGQMRLIGQEVDLAAWLTGPDALEGGFTLALGVWLVLGSRQIVRALKRWQTPRPEEEPSEEGVEDAT